MDNQLFRYGKKVIGYPEESVPVITTDDWIRQHTSDPLKRVSNSLGYESFLIVWQFIDQGLCTELIPYIDLDNTI